MPISIRNADIPLPPLPADDASPEDDFAQCLLWAQAYRAAREAGLWQSWGNIGWEILMELVERVGAPKMGQGIANNEAPFQVVTAFEPGSLSSADANDLADALQRVLDTPWRLVSREEVDAGAGDRELWQHHVGSDPDYRLFIGWLIRLLRRGPTLIG